MGPYLPVIERWLDDDETAPRKQRHTAQRIYDRLVDEYGFTGSEVTVRRAVRALRGPPRSKSSCRSRRPRQGRPGRLRQRRRDSRRGAHRGRPLLPAGQALQGALRRRLSDRAARGLPRRPRRGVCLLRRRLRRALVRQRQDRRRASILAGPEREEHERFSRLRAHYLFDSSLLHAGTRPREGLGREPRRLRAPQRARAAHALVRLARRPERASARLVRA